MTLDHTASPTTLAVTQPVTQPVARAATQPVTPAVTQPDAPPPTRVAAEVAHELGGADLGEIARLTHQQRSDLTHELLMAAHATDDADERQALLDRVVLVNRRVAQAVASRYRGRGVPDDDLEQAAYEGLVKAVSHFDPALRHDLLSYAVPTMRGEIQRYFRDHSWTVRPPRRLQEQQWRLNRTIDELAGELGREPSDGEVCERMGIDGAEHREVVASFGCFQPPSLDQPVRSADGLTLGDALPDASSDLEEAEVRAALVPELQRLPPRDRRIVFLRYFEDRTQQEIGDDLGVTQMQVSRLLTRILRDLRERLQAGGAITEH